MQGTPHEYFQFRCHILDQLRVHSFHSLFNSGRRFTFPGNRNGQVDVDRLSACTIFIPASLLGCELAVPVVQIRAMQTEPKVKLPT